MGAGSNVAVSRAEDGEDSGLLLLEDSDLLVDRSDEHGATTQATPEVSGHGVPQPVKPAGSTTFRANESSTSGEFDALDDDGGDLELASIEDLALIQSCPSVSSETLIPVVARMFQEDGSIHAVPVVDRGRPTGLITRRYLQAKLSARFGYELFSRRSVSAVIPEQLGVVCVSDTVEDVLAVAMARDKGEQYDDMVVVGPLGAYRGLISVRDMVVTQSETLADILVQEKLTRARAREAVEMTGVKSRFIAHVTHELRAPVNTIIGLVDVIRNLSGDPDTVAQMIDLLAANARNLQTLVNNVLDVSKLEAGKMDVLYSEVEIEELLEEVAGSTRVLVGDKPVEVMVDWQGPGLVVHSDAIKLKRILVNLATNAAKFTPSGHVALRGWHTPPRGGQPGLLFLAVEDTGIGIAPHELDQLFEAFSQVEHAKTRQLEGTGLGLTIVHNMVALMEGTVEVRSKPGDGTTFTICLPNRPEEV